MVWRRDKIMKLWVGKGEMEEESAKERGEVEGMKLNQDTIGAGLSLSALFFKHYLCNECTPNQHSTVAVTERVSWVHGNSCVRRFG